MKNVYARLKEIEIELAKLETLPKTPENDDKYWDLEEEKRSLIWEIDARIY